MKTPALDPSQIGLQTLPCVTRSEFALLLRISVRTVDRMIAGGEIRVRRVRGKAVRILRSDVERYLEKADPPSRDAMEDRRLKPNQP